MIKYYYAEVPNGSRLILSFDYDRNSGKGVERNVTDSTDFGRAYLTPLVTFIKTFSLAPKLGKINIIFQILSSSIGVKLRVWQPPNQGYDNDASRSLFPRIHIFRKKAFSPHHSQVYSNTKSAIDAFQELGMKVNEQTL